jgi:hypothetical protein
MRINLMNAVAQSEGLRMARSIETVALAEAAYAAGPAPLEPGGIPGHGALTLLILKLAEAMEREAAVAPDPDQPPLRRGRRRADAASTGSSRLQTLLDEVASSLFQIRDGTTARV